MYLWVYTCICVYVYVCAYTSVHECVHAHVPVDTNIGPHQDEPCTSARPASAPGCGARPVPAAPPFRPGRPGCSPAIAGDPRARQQPSLQKGGALPPGRSSRLKKRHDKHVGVYVYVCRGVEMYVGMYVKMDVEMYAKMDVNIHVHVTWYMTKIGVEMYAEIVSETFSPAGARTSRRHIPLCLASLPCRRT